MSGVLLEKKKGARKWPVRLESGEVVNVYGGNLSVRGRVAARPPKRKSTKTTKKAAKKTLRKHSNRATSSSGAPAAAKDNVQGQRCPSDSDSDRPRQQYLSGCKHQAPQYRKVVPCEVGRTGKFTLQFDKSQPSIQIIESGKYKGAKWLCNSPVTASTWCQPAQVCAEDRLQNDWHVSWGTWVPALY